MDSAMIGQIEKSIQYAQNPDRIQLVTFEALFDGSHNKHLVTYQEQQWHCDCKAFNNRGVCAHIMTLERVLADWVSPASLPSSGYDATMIGQIDKSRHYAQEPERIHFQKFTAVFSGNHNSHTVKYNEATWDCDCHIFETRGVCSHVMAMERLLAGWVEYAQGLPTPA